MSFEAVFGEPPESFRSIDEVEAELEFRYVTPSDLETLKQLTSDGAGSLETSFASKRTPTPMLRNVDLDWWVETYTKPMYKPSLDGFSMDMTILSGEMPIVGNKSSIELSPLARNESTPIELWKRYPGEHNSSNFAAPESRNVTVSEIHGKIDQDNPVVKFKFSDQGRTIPESLEFINRLENSSSRHANQPYKNRHRLKNQNTGNEYNLQPHHNSASTRPLQWWSNDVKNVMKQGGVNKFRLSFNYDEGVTTYPSAVSENKMLPVVIVKSVKVKYTLSPVTNLKLDNLRISIAGGNISGIKDYKIESVNNTFFTVDNSDNFITVDELSGDVRAVIYRQDEERNKSILVSDLGSPLKLSEPSGKGYSAMLFTTTNANSDFNSGTVFGYVPDKPEHFSKAGSMFVGIPNSGKTFIKDFGLDDENFK